MIVNSASNDNDNRLNNSIEIMTVTIIGVIEVMITIRMIDITMVTTI